MTTRAVRVVAVEDSDPEVTVMFKLSELRRWHSYAESYANSMAPGTDWFLANMIGGILDEVKDRRNKA